MACSVGYILVHFEPSASQKTAHHMLLYGCSLPGALLPSWWVQLYINVEFSALCIS